MASAGDALVDGILVELLDDGGNVVDSATTVGGTYTFTGVVPGDYTVRPVAPTGTTFTVPNAGTDDAIDSEWVITSTGQVLASGWASLVNPTEGCGYAPAAAFGPGGGGSARGLLHWFTPLELSTEVWVALSTRDDTDATGLVLR